MEKRIGDNGEKELRIKKYKKEGEKLYGWIINAHCKTLVWHEA